MIPYKAFLLLSSSIRHMAAEEELRLAHGHAFGAGLSFGDKSAKRKLERLSRRLSEEAYPTDGSDEGQDEEEDVTATPAPDLSGVEVITEEPANGT